MGLILLMILIVLLVGGLPVWGYSRRWGYVPSAFWGLLIAVVLGLLAFDVLPRSF